MKIIFYLIWITILDIIWGPSGFKVLPKICYRDRSYCKHCKYWNCDNWRCGVD